MKEVGVSTPYGMMNAVTGNYQGFDVVFMNRHGKGHSVPHDQLSRQHLGLKELGVTKIMATAAVGSFEFDMARDTFVFPDQYLEFTKARQCTFFWTAGIWGLFIRI